ncbi:MAG: CRTAC1 family protein [Xanthomonadales bacterium]|nr:CRTAC1 family protein [Xanthomonadales bacterium]
MSKDPREEELLASEVGYEDEVPEDDTIIGQALKWSLIVIGAAALLLGAMWLVLKREPVPEVVTEAEPARAESVPTAIDVQPPAVPFTNVTREAGIDFVHENGAYGERLLPETMGGGVAFLDYDSDGWPDLLFVNSGHWPWRDSGGTTPQLALYRNLGDGRFGDMTEAAQVGGEGSYGMGVAVADYDGDGHSDIFVSAVGANRLLRNTGAGTFEDVTGSAGVAGSDDSWSTSAAFFDYDGDGDLDLFVCNYVEWSRDIDIAVDYRLTGIGRAYGPPTNYAGTFSYLYRNDGDGTFEDVSAEAGIQVVNPATGLPAGKALAVLPVDLNDDGHLDLVVANDTVQNFLFINRGDGSFEESGMVAGIAFDNTGSATGAMGIDAAPYRDREIAVAVGNFSNEMTSFYVSQAGLPQFTDHSMIAGIGPESRQALSFGLFFFDYDLDGRIDLLQTNGHVEDEINVVQPSQHYEQPTQLFWQCGPDCQRTFMHVPLDQTGDLSQPVVGRGAAFADFDSDGDLDVVITQVDRPPLLLRNDQALGHHWLRVKVHGSGANPDAIGARVVATVNGVEQWRTVMPARSYLSQVELPVTFGLGEAARVERLEVTWPDGHRQVLENVAVDQRLEVGPPEGDVP